MGDYTDYPKLRLAHSHLLLKLTHPIHYLSFGKLGLKNWISMQSWTTMEPITTQRFVPG